jgi:hypothetical protein
MKPTMLFLAIVACGCAVNRPVLTETVTSTNGTVTTRSMKVTTFALWPATTSLEKQRVTLGKTFGVGTEGLKEDGGGTNVVEALRSLDSILGKIK